MRVARRLPNQGSAVHPGLRGSLLLHALREHAQQSVHAEIARRPAGDQRHEAEPEHRQQVGSGAVQGPAAAAEAEQSRHGREHRGQTDVGPGHPARLQAPPQAVRSRREEPMPLGAVSVPRGPSRVSGEPIELSDRPGA